MTAQTSFEIPSDHRFIMADGSTNPVWIQWAERVGKAIETLRRASESMDDLTSGTTTLAEMVTAWEELRTDLQEIA